MNAQLIGETVTTVIPIHPDTDSESILEEVGRHAHEALERACAEHGLKPSDVRSVFHGTAQAAREKNPAWLRNLDAVPDDFFIGVFEATAAQG